MWQYGGSERIVGPDPLLGWHRPPQLRCGLWGLTSRIALADHNGLSQRLAGGHDWRPDLGAVVTDPNSLSDRHLSPRLFTSAIR